MRTAVLFLLAATTALTACDDRPATVNPASLQTPGFEGVPIPDQASELAPVATTDGISSQAFEVRGSTPQEVMAFYEASVPDDWTTVVAPGPLGFGDEVEAGSEANVHLGGWTTGERDLLVTVGPSAGRVQVVQLNLMAGPSNSGILDVGAAVP
jgi:hypothetical protein